MDAIDSQAREEIANLKYRFGELAADYWGVNRDNGKRSELLSLTKKQDAFEKYVTHFIDSEREKTCFGLAALKFHDEEHEAEKVEEGEIMIEKIRAGSNEKTSQWQVTALIIGQVLTLLGLVANAILGK